MHSQLEATVARRVLDDVREALEDLRKNPTGGRWRRQWVACVALLRTVVEALAKVDAKKPFLKPFIDAELAALGTTKPKPEIYWGFIRSTANDILHEYQLQTGQGVTVRIGGPTSYHYEMLEGPFKGRDQRDVVAAAVRWYEHLISEIEARATAQRSIDLGKV